MDASLIVNVKKFHDTVDFKATMYMYHVCPSHLHVFLISASILLTSHRRPVLYFTRYRDVLGAGVGVKNWEDISSIQSKS